MGVDIGLKVKIINPETQKSEEITVTDQDNSFGSLIDGSNEIKYTSIKIIREEFITDEEFAKIKLNYDETDEMRMKSEIINAEDAFKIFDKISRLLYRVKRESLNSDINKINELDLTLETKNQKNINQIGEYMDFEQSFAQIQGIIKVAKQLKWDIQLIGEYY